jgi:hypothetical protein
MSWRIRTLRESLSTMKFFGIAGAIYVLCLGGAILLTSPDMIFAATITRYGLELTLLYIGVVSIIFWIRKSRYEEKYRGNDS